MKMLVRFVIMLSLAFTVASCSRGGADDAPVDGSSDTGGSNFGKPQNGVGNGSAVGQWNDGTNTLVITSNSMSFSGHCVDGSKFNFQAKANVTAKTIVVQETKNFCGTSVTKGQSIPYAVTGDTLTIHADGEQMVFNRVGGNNGGQSNGGGGQGATSFVFFEGGNCGGRKVAFKKGSDCTDFVGSPVLSVQVSGQCTDFQGQKIDAGQLCQQINAQ